MTIAPTNPLTNALSPEVRRYAYALAFVASLALGAWQAAAGDWAQAAFLFAGSLISALAGSNVPTKAPVALMPAAPLAASVACPVTRCGERFEIPVTNTLYGLISRPDSGCIEVTRPRSPDVDEHIRAHVAAGDWASAPKGSGA